MGNLEVNASSSKLNPDVNSFLTWFYNTIRCDVPKPDYEVFTRAITGFFNLKSANKIKNNLLTIVDFSLSSNMERMWIVDMNKIKVVHHSLVAHGRNSGDEFATSFSNRPSSNQSSLGFYLTDETYYGGHGMSLYLDGVEPGVNDKARERAIVMHGAGYVSRDFIRRNGRLGRSFGCPSIPMENHEEIISMLSGRSCIYIHYPDEKYLSTSTLFDMETALAEMYNLLSEKPS
ncbi:MAG: murein L,D-transpeptidase catalytic domain family protein [Bacteroidales bacterium]